MEFIIFIVALCTVGCIYLVYMMMTSDSPELSNEKKVVTENVLINKGGEVIPVTTEVKNEEVIEIVNSSSDTIPASVEIKETDVVVAATNSKSKKTQETAKTGAKKPRGRRPSTKKA